MMNLPLGEENATYEKELKKCWDEGFDEGRAERDRLKSINRDLLEAVHAILPWVKVISESSRNQVDAAYTKALAAIAKAA